VLLGEKGIPLADVLAELGRREGTSGLDEKASRGA
jgi:phosphoribosyl-ATP pyrophosphohydrolase